MSTLWWIRDDLRLADNPALGAAVADGPVVALHVGEDLPGARRPGGATRWWLHHSLTALAARLRTAGVPLVLAGGDPRRVVADVARAAGADAVVWNRRYHQPHRDADARIKADLIDAGVAAESFAGHLLHEPWRVTTKGAPFRVYSAFARAWRDAPPPRAPLPEPAGLRGPRELSALVAGRPLTAWLDARAWAGALDARGWLPTAPDWAGGLRERWTPGEAGALERLDALGEVLPDYREDRDRPGRDGTSSLSPHLRSGEVSPFQVWHASLALDGAGPRTRDGAEKFRGELLWREFAWHRRYHLPDLATVNIRREFDDFPWDGTEATLRAWQAGRTGFPLVDAGMRELWETGYMHNRVRMVAASFLVKNLRHHWRAGEEWFWDTLVDADEANNPVNWQWVAGTGDDAAPYVRIFNPERQRERFDPDGSYVERWLGDLGPVRELEVPPIVDLAASRAQALAAFQELGRR